MKTYKNVDSKTMSPNNEIIVKSNVFFNGKKSNVFFFIKKRCFSEPEQIRCIK